MKHRRLHEISKELGLSSKALIKLLRSKGFKVKGHMSFLTDEEISALKTAIEEKKESLRIEDIKKLKIRKKGIEANKKWKKAKKREIEQEKIKEKVKETLTRMEIKEKPKKKKEVSYAPEEEQKKIRVGEYTSVIDFAKLLDIDPLALISRCLKLGLMITLNQRLDFDTIATIAAEYGYEAELIPYYIEEEEKKESLKVEKRPPVVTVMGHVDHGKTLLLDCIRRTQVAKSEKGGITQHIGASQIEFRGRKITFIDTPGHEAFTAMRARGAQVTDIVVLVVAADDSVMPQTIESLNHAKDAGVPIIVAINKIDIEGVDIEKVKYDLLEHNVRPEEYGGDTVVCPISAKTGEGVEELLEAILLQADMEELTAEIEGPAKGVVIEAKLDKGRGPVATVLIQNGVLKQGDVFVSGTSYGKVKSMFNEWGEVKEFSYPSEPTQIVGFDELPEIGDTFTVFEDEEKAREISRKRKMAAKQEMRKEKKEISFEKVQEELKKGELQELKVIIKGDVSGSVEALADAVEKLIIKDVKIKVVHKGVGDINESDVLLASASNAIIVGYHVKENLEAGELAKERGVTIRKYDIIYDAIENLKLAMEGMLVPEYEEIEIGKAKIKQIFKIKDVGLVAGIEVLSGKVIKGKKTRIKRENEIIYQDEIKSVKRFQQEVEEVDKGLECGISFNNKSLELKKDDIIEVYEVREKK